ncbi:MAG TPA: response regulator [Patescibacteria group bacterium]|nr:response regulator [Patescibacteria group bacterium]
MKILIIEDDKFFQKFYTFKLREQKFEVSVAGNGEEGLQKVKSFMPNLIILDLIMPKIDGFAVLSALQKDSLLKAIPVLVFSTLGQEKDVIRAKKLGAKDYVNKSFFDFDKLVTKINQFRK